MPNSKVNDPITDQEIAFAHLVLSGAMTDRQAAESVGLNPDSAAYTKAKPRVRAYMLEHRSAGQQQLVQQDVERLPRFNPDREQVLARLWQLAHLGPEMTRGSITGQVKSLSLIIAIQNFIPDRRAAAAEKKSTPVLTAQIYESAWLRKQKAEKQATTTDPQPSPTTAQEEDQQDSPGIPEPGLAPEPIPTQPTLAHRVPLADGLAPYAPVSTFVPDTRVPFSIKRNPLKRNPFGRRP
jgi:hypothetical protein